MVGIEEGTCWDEHWVLHVSNEPRESAPKTNSTLYTQHVSQFGNKLYFKNNNKDSTKEKKKIQSIVLEKLFVNQISNKGLASRM